MIDQESCRFSCVSCGACCRQPGWVHFSASDRRRAAHYLGIPVARFRVLYGEEEEDGTWIRVTRKKRCPFLFEDRCSIYKAKPEQCRTFPFWSEILESKRTWNRTARGCPGMNTIP